VVFNICKTKSICETGEDEDPQLAQQAEDPLGEHKKRPHGGCGNFQPKISREGLKLTAEFKNVLDESVEKKQLLTAEKVTIRHYFYRTFLTCLRRC
jgi:DNA-directed RNA polymerase II subunit RPB1